MAEKKEKAIIEIINQDEALALFGQHDDNLKYIERETGLKCVSRNGEIIITGKGAIGVAKMLEGLLGNLRAGRGVTKADVRYGLMMLQDGLDESDWKTDLEVRLCDSAGRPIKPRSPRQREYIQALNSHDLVFAIGPAGTGKTYLAVAVAARMLQNENVKRIIICRPAVEAGEKLGFLPGDFQQKVDPYLRPIYDALFGLMNVDKCMKLLERNIIEVAPLAFMRGRTLDEAFVILDEAQNTTVEQMKMFLTRLGPRSRAAVTGDVTQIDLPADKTSGLVDASTRLVGIEGIGFVQFSPRDVVRHDLVARVIRAYESTPETES